MHKLTRPYSKAFNMMCVLIHLGKCVFNRAAWILQRAHLQAEKTARATAENSHPLQVTLSEKNPATPGREKCGQTAWGEHHSRRTDSLVRAERKKKKNKKNQGQKGPPNSVQPLAIIPSATASQTNPTFSPSPVNFAVRKPRSLLAATWGPGRDLGTTWAAAEKHSWELRGDARCAVLLKGVLFRGAREPRIGQQASRPGLPCAPDAGPGTLGQWQSILGGNGTGMARTGRARVWRGSASQMNAARFERLGVLRSSMTRIPSAGAVQGSPGPSTQPSIHTQNREAPYLRSHGDRQIDAECGMRTANTLNADVWSTAALIGTP